MASFEAVRSRLSPLGDDGESRSRFGRKTWLTAAATLAGVAAGTAAIVTTVAGPQVSHEAPVFLKEQLGARVADPVQATVSIVRAPAKDVKVTIAPSGFVMKAEAAQVHLRSADAAGGAWTAHDNGAVRATPFGNETVIVGKDFTEQFLTVNRKVGKRTWSWRLDSNLGMPRVGADGYVVFVKNHKLAQDIAIKPPVVLDTLGNDITPRATRWSIAVDAHGPLLQLQLDDAKLPAGYVIDPIAFRAGAYNSTTNSGSAAYTAVSVPVPLGLQAGDLVFAAAVNTTANNTAAAAAGTGPLAAVLSETVRLVLAAGPSAKPVP